MPESKALLHKYEKTIKDNYAIVKKSIGGVKASVFFDLALIMDIDKNKLADDIFLISLKTIKRYNTENKKLNPRNSELSLKLLALYKKGMDVFGTIDSFNRWLNKPALGLGDNIPFHLLNTTTGIDLIYEALIRIEYGDLA